MITFDELKELKKDQMNVQLIKSLDIHAAAIYALIFDQEEGRLYTGSADRMVGSWDVQLYEPLPFSVKLDSAVFSLAKLNNNLLVGQGEGGVHVIDLKDKKELRHLKYHSKPVFRIMFEPSLELFFFLGGDGLLSIVDSVDYKLKWSLPLASDKLRCLLFDQKSKNLLIGSSDGYLRVLETDYFNQIEEFLAHEGGVYDLTWNCDGSLISVGRDGHIRRWIKKGESFEEQNAVPAHNYAIYAIDLSPSKKRLVTASRDKTIKLWSADDLSFEYKINRIGPVGHTHSVNRVSWIDDQTFVSCGDDKSLNFWSIKGS
jgi:WD40 repeat protein